MLKFRTDRRRKAMVDHLHPHQMVESDQLDLHHQPPEMEVHLHHHPQLPEMVAHHHHPRVLLPVTVETVELLLHHHHRLVETVTTMVAMEADMETEMEAETEADAEVVTMTAAVAEDVVADMEAAAVVAAAKKDTSASQLSQTSSLLCSQPSHLILPLLRLWPQTTSTPWRRLPQLTLLHPALLMLTRPPLRRGSLPTFPRKHSLTL